MQIDSYFDLKKTSHHRRFTGIGLYESETWLTRILIIVIIAANPQIIHVVGGEKTVMKSDVST